MRITNILKGKFKLAVLAVLGAVLLGCTVLLCLNAYGEKQPQNSADTIKKEDISVSTGLEAEGAKPNDISAPKLEATATAATVNSGTTASAMATAWANAVTQSSATNQVTFVLEADWTAAADATYTTSFGTGTGFYNGQLYVASGKNIVLDLNGHTLNRNLTTPIKNQGRVLYVGGTLEIKDASTSKNGTITGGYESDYSAGSGVYVYGGTVTMSGGKITGNKSDYDGTGVFVSNGTFEMTGGTITGNTSNYDGGGVTVYYGSRFTMSGGTISGNTARLEGGGVYVSASGATFEMTGGTISGNTAGTRSGGVYVSAGTVKLSGSPKIYGNKVGSDDSDVYSLSSIAVSGRLNSDAKVGLGYSGIITSGYSTYNSGEDPNNYFFSNSGVEIFTYEGEVAASSDMNALIWASAVNASLKDKTQKTVTLQEDWTAATDAAYTTSFGTSTGFNNGRLHVPSGAYIVLDLNGYTIDRKLTSKRSDGSVIYVEGTLEIKDTSSSQLGKITGGYNAGSGGGVYVSGSSARFTLTSGTISGNNASSGNGGGGGVYVVNGRFTMNGGTISGNTVTSTASTSSGGGVYVSSGIFTMSGGTISGNTASSYWASTGGGVYVGGTSSTYCSLKGGSITGNTAYYGGGVFGGRNITFDSSVQITGNNATFGSEVCFAPSCWSDAIEYSLEHTTTQTCVVQFNGSFSASSGSFGTGTGYSEDRLHVPSGANIVLDLNGYTIDRKLTSARANGSVIYVEGKLEIVDNSASQGGKITGGYISGSGGAVYNIGTFTLSGGTITGNRASSNGGGVYVAGGTFTMKGGSITGNTATGSGGGVYMAGGTFEMKGGSITGNTATSNGGGMYVDGGTFKIGGSIRITDNTVGSNKNNVQLANSLRITVADALAGSRIGIYGTSTATFTTGYNTYNSGVNPGVYFVSDAGRAIVLTGSEAAIGTTTAPVQTTLTWKYSTSSYGTYTNIPADGKLTYSSYYYVKAYNGTTEVPISKTVYKKPDGSTESSSSIVNAGTYSFTIDSANYTNPSFTLTILPKEVTVVWSNTTLTYNGSVQYPTATLSTGSATVTLSTSSAGTNAGEYSVAVTGLSGSYAYNYKLSGSAQLTCKYTINPAPLAKATVALGSDSAVYTGSAIKPAVSSVTVNGLTVTSSHYTLTYSDNINVGTATVTLTGKGNYTGMVSKTFTITPASITSAQVTFGTGNYIYTGSAISAIPTVTWNSKNLAQTVDFTVAYTGNVNAGTATATVTGTGNYTGSATGTFTIDPKEIFVAGIKVADKPYDGTKNATVDMTGVRLIGVIDADKANLGLDFTAGSEFDGSSVGLHKVEITGVTLTGTAAGNYMLEANEVTGYAQIYPKTVTVSGITAKDKIYDGNMSVEFDASGLAIAGAVSGELQDLLNNMIIVRGHFDSADAGTSVSVTITGYILQGQYAGNYYVDLTNSQLSTSAAITPKTATVSVDNVTKGLANISLRRTDEAKKIGYTVEGAIAGDVLDVDISIAEIGLQGTNSVNWGNVGIFDITATVNNSNYNIAYVYGGDATALKGTFNVTSGKLIITAKPLAVIYGEEVKFGDDWDLYLSVEGLPANSTLKSMMGGAITGTLKAITTYNVGDDIYDASGNKIAYTVTPGGLESTNYELVFVAGSLIIEPKPITVTLDNKSSVYGDATAALTASVEANALYGFDPAKDTVENFLGFTINKAAGTDYGSYAITATDGSNKNYRITFVNGVYTVTQCEVAVTWSGNAFTYNGDYQAPAATLTATNGTRLTSSEFEVTGSGKNVGNYKAQAFILNNNYKFASNADDVKLFTIDPKKLSVTWYDKQDGTAYPAGSTVEYDYKAGQPYAPVAVLADYLDADKNGLYYVSGAQSEVNSYGAYTAQLHILNANYTVDRNDTVIYFVIRKAAPKDFGWYDTLNGNRISADPKYTFNGTAQHPVAYALGDAQFVYVYYTVNGTTETKVTETMHVGSYKVVVTPVDNNYEIDATTATFYYTIAAKAVDVTWGELSFEYNGKVQKPNPTVVGANGALLDITVTAQNSIDADDYNIEVALKDSDYTFVNEDGNNVNSLTKTYTITGKEVKVTWESKYTEDGKYVWGLVYDGDDHNGDVTAKVEISNAIDGEDLSTLLSLAVTYQTGSETPVTSSAVHDAGTYTFRVSVSSSNYNVVNAEQAFTITPKNLTLTATGKEVSTGAVLPPLTAESTDFAAKDDAEELLKEVAGYLGSNYNSNSKYIDISDYTKAEDITKLVTLADIANGNINGYFIVIRSDEALAAIEAILHNYNVTFVYGKVTINAVEGTVSIVLTQYYNGEEQKPAAMYKVGNTWVDLDVEVYTDATYTVKADSVKDVGDYYLIIKKSTENNIPLEGAEADGTVKKVYSIVARRIEVTISNKSVVYGELTDGNVESYLAGMWEYASKDPLRQPLAGDEALLNIRLSADVTFKNGYGIVNTYDVKGEWDQNANYNVIFVGSNGDKGELKVTEAEITFYDNIGEYNQIIDKGSSTVTALPARDGDVYKYFSFVGDQNAEVKIYYSSINNIADINRYLPEDDEILKNKTIVIAPDFYGRNDGEYFVNFMIVIDNHETYYGQWTVTVESDKIYIRVIFVKDYEITYGDSVPNGKDLADALWKGGYIDRNETGIQNVFQTYIDNGTITAKVVAEYDRFINAGSYAILFEGLDKIGEGNYEVAYKKDINDTSAATNLNRFVVNKRDITLGWDNTTFVYDGEKHIPQPSIDGWKVLSTAEADGVTVYTFENEVTGATLKLNVRTNGNFTEIGSENIVTAEVEGDNYLLDSFNATRAVSITAGDEPVTPVVQKGGLPAWALAVIITLGVITLLLMVFLAFARRRTQPADDSDGFYDDVGPND